MTDVKFPVGAIGIAPYNLLFNAQPFAVMGKGNDRFHVGMGVIGEDSLRPTAGPA